jgi:hypothetical protein
LVNRSAVNQAQLGGTASFRQQPLDEPQLVRVTLLVAVENAVVVEWVDAHLTVSMQNLAFFQHQPNVNDTAFSVLKECQIAQFSLRNEVYRLATVNLLAGIARELHSHKPE